MKNIKSKSLKELLAELKENRGKAPQIIRKRIDLVFISVAALIFLAFVILLVSFIPAAHFIWNIGLVCIVIAAYLLMSLPKYMKCCTEYTAITGKVYRIRKNHFKSILSMQNFQSVILRSCICAGKEESEREIQIPDTMFMHVSAGRYYTFYFDSDDFTINHYLAHERPIGQILREADNNA